MLLGLPVFVSGPVIPWTVLFTVVARLAPAVPAGVDCVPQLARTQASASLGSTSWLPVMPFTTVVTAPATPLTTPPRPVEPLLLDESVLAGGVLLLGGGSVPVRPSTVSPTVPATPFTVSPTVSTTPFTTPPTGLVVPPPPSLLLPLPKRPSSPSAEATPALAPKNIVLSRATAARRAIPLRQPRVVLPDPSVRFCDTVFIPLVG